MNVIYYRIPFAWKINLCKAFCLLFVYPAKEFFSLDVLDILKATIYLSFLARWYTMDRCRLSQIAIKSNGTDTSKAQYQVMFLVYAVCKMIAFNSRVASSIMPLTGTCVLFRIMKIYSL